MAEPKKTTLRVAPVSQAPPEVAEVSEAAEAPMPKRPSLFDKFRAVDTGGGGDIVNFEILPGENKFRLLPKPPVLVRKHFDTPESSTSKVAICRHYVTDEMAEGYAEAKKKSPAAVLEFLESHGTVCEYCRWHAEKPEFYTPRDSHVFLVEQDDMAKVAEFHQGTILRGLAALDADVEWLEASGGRVENLTIKLTKAEKGGRTEYTVACSPKVVPLPADKLEALLANAPDLLKLKMPPGDDEKGNAKWAEWLAKAGEPKEGEKPHPKKF